MISGISVSAYGKDLRLSADDDAELYCFTAAYELLTAHENPATRAWTLIATDGRLCAENRPCHNSFTSLPFRRPCCPSSLLLFKNSLEMQPLHEKHTRCPDFLETVTHHIQRERIRSGASVFVPPTFGCVHSLIKHCCSHSLVVFNCSILSSAHLPTQSSLLMPAVDNTQTFNR